MEKRWNEWTLEDVYDRVKKAHGEQDWVNLPTMAVYNALRELMRLKETKLEARVDNYMAEMDKLVSS